MCFYFLVNWGFGERNGWADFCFWELEIAAEAGDCGGGLEGDEGMFVRGKGGKGWWMRRCRRDVLIWKAVRDRAGKLHQFYMQFAICKVDA